MSFVDDVDLVATGDAQKMDVLAQVADIVYSGIRGGVDLDDSGERPPVISRQERHHCTAHHVLDEHSSPPWRAAGRRSSSRCRGARRRGRHAPGGRPAPHFAAYVSLLPDL